MLAIGSADRQLTVVDCRSINSSSHSTNQSNQVHSFSFWLFFHFNQIFISEFENQRFGKWPTLTRMPFEVLNGIHLFHIGYLVHQKILRSNYGIWDTLVNRWQFYWVTQISSILYVWSFDHLIVRSLLFEFQIWFDLILDWIDQLAWSKTHCEILASCSVDRSLRLWGLNQLPTFEIASITDPFSHSTIGGLFFTLPFSLIDFLIELTLNWLWYKVEFTIGERKSICHSISENGEFVSIELKDEFIGPIAPTKLKTTDEMKRKAEMTVYTHDFRTGFELIFDQAFACKQRGSSAPTHPLID